MAAQTLVALADMENTEHIPIAGLDSREKPHKATQEGREYGTET